METLIFISIPLAVWFCYKQFIEPFILLKKENTEENNEKTNKFVQFTVAISAMKEKDLIKITLNKNESEKRINEALERLKILNIKIHTKVLERLK